MQRALIFDCFGVLYQGSLQHLRQLASDDVQQQLTDLSHASDYGYISRNEYMQRVAELTGLTTQQVEDIIETDHVRNEAMIEVVRASRHTHKTALLSNVGRGIIRQLFTPSELTELFDVVVLSSEVGLVKPYPEIYELTAQQLGVPTERCYMIDDMPANIDGARAVGMDGVVFESASQVRAALHTQPS